MNERVCLKCDTKVPLYSKGYCAFHRKENKTSSTKKGTIGVKDESSWKPIVNINKLRGKPRLILDEAYLLRSRKVGKGQKYRTTVPTGGLEELEKVVKEENTKPAK